VAAGCAVLLTSLAYLVGRRAAANAPIAGGVGVVAVEVIYTMNAMAGEVFYPVGSKLARVSNAVGAVVFGAVAAAGMVAGVYLLVKP
jgi:hypothetical protein